ncbi:Methyltransferase pytC [Fulvia fulva]|uniref:Methyltransferase pytC n=1 Tax=Passalora fulva TaxID=5499 RepID=A0A9Q8P6E6_PASFU|nr:Methyltransferase pytC [Fulvia fulva]KAK4628839.1 Methyltransferase pytC [Fulvia fulva]KAK4630317.1 Methyltransferase pytC [Fulvia fulva]UJO14881.1 Methyltransferase pytC [Fulvia fulva]WPV12603.1 Methyltransferase pytC [Fulvia fulva]WPV27151.1 Methyltransferase pytC [Fulvia fulva]
MDPSPMWHGTLPANSDLFVQDAEADWEFKSEEALDFVHGRAMGASIADWPGLYKDTMKHLKPGGWAEVQEYDAWIYSDTDPKMEQAPNIDQLQQLCDEASKKHGKHFNNSEFQKQWMIDAGFTNVQEVVFKTPIGSWAKDPELKEVGKKERKNLIACVESFALAPLTRIMGWSATDAHSLTAKIRNEFRDPNLRMTSVYRYVYGQKPSE